MLNLISDWQSAKTCNEFHNKHYNEECFIIGGGSSLKFMDLKKFKDRPIIGVNLLPFHVDFLELNVSYVTITQPRIFVPWVLKKPIDKDFKNVAALYKKISIQSDATFFVHFWAKFFNYGIKNWRAVPHYVWDPDKKVRSMKAYGGALYASLSLARLMGFKNITLVGFDAFTLKNHSNLRWFEIGHKTDHTNRVDNIAIDFFELLGKEGIKISTIGIDTGSICPILDYIEYSKFYSCEPVYKENNKLLIGEAYSALQTYKHVKVV